MPAIVTNRLLREEPYVICTARVLIDFEADRASTINVDFEKRRMTTRSRTAFLYYHILSHRRRQLDAKFDGKVSRCDVESRIVAVTDRSVDRLERQQSTDHWVDNADIIDAAHTVQRAMQSVATLIGNCSTCAVVVVADVVVVVQSPISQRPRAKHNIVRRNETADARRCCVRCNRTHTASRFPIAKCTIDRRTATRPQRLIIQ